MYPTFYNNVTAFTARCLDGDTDASAIRALDSWSKTSSNCDGSYSASASKRSTVVVQWCDRVIA
jgi:hypothetical protein